MEIAIISLIVFSILFHRVVATVACPEPSSIDKFDISQNTNEKIAPSNQDIFMNILRSKTFISWVPLLVYLTTRISNSRDSLLFGARSLRLDFGRYGDGFTVLIIHAIYIGVLYFYSKKIDSFIAEKVDENKVVFFHGVAITLIVLVSAFMLNRDFDLMLKLGIIWSTTMIQWFFHSK